MTSTLRVYLHGVEVGALNLLANDRVHFAFKPSFLKSSPQPILSQSFITNDGVLMADVRPTQTKVPPFFANLLPEGHLRECLASIAGISAKRDFGLLQQLGRDLPGAVELIADDVLADDVEDESDFANEEQLYKFSLAGVQLKFSALMESAGGLTIPAMGIGGDWIVKLPSAIYQNVPENEYAMMMMAKEMGINVPEVRLIELSKVRGLPEFTENLSSKALAIKRFDRVDGQKIHF